MGTKLNQVLNCHEKVPSLKLHDILKVDRVTIVKSLDQLKKYICILQDLLPLNVASGSVATSGSRFRVQIHNL